jgi:radical SAM superfamily enzyme YgiQ (UPF0313 family)
MILRTRLDRAPLVISLKSSSCSLALGDHHVVAWDLGGRLYSVYRDGHTFRRGLNGAVLHKWRDGEVRERERLDTAAADRLLDECVDLAARALAALTDRTRPAETARDDETIRKAAEALEAAARFDSLAARDDVTRFEEVYRPIGILPPDQYLALVLQATEGCSFGSCTFCDLYREPYRVRSVAELVSHARAVVAYLGPSIGLRGRSIFLGSANALAIPMSGLVPLFEVVQRELGASSPPVHAFVDGFTGLRKSPADYAALAALGLRRVYIGLESGHDPLLEFVRKPASRAQAVATVRAIKQAGLQVGVIVMVGLGGHLFSDGHVRDTADALAQMTLGRGDLVYFSELVEAPGTTYPRLAEAASIRPLDRASLRAQREAIAAGISGNDNGPQHAVYDVREFVY